MFVFVLCNTFTNLCEVYAELLKSGYGFICFGYGLYIVLDMVLYVLDMG